MGFNEVPMCGNVLRSERKNVMNEEKLMKAVGMIHNAMCNMAAAYENRDWELLRQAYLTLKQEIKEEGLPPFVGGPNLEGVLSK